ncbi:MAG: hypothetical protein ACSLEW_09885 [Nocardioides sp.]
MLRSPHELVATVLVDPALLPDLELELMERDIRVWPVASAPTVIDGSRLAFQIRHRMLTAHRGEWDCAASWVPVWVSFGESWRKDPSDVLPWPARKQLWQALEAYADRVRYRKWFSGVRPLLAVPADVA